MGRMTTLNESSSLSEIDFIKKGPNGIIYGIVRENRNYFIKTTEKTSGTLMSEYFNYSGGIQNKYDERYHSYAEALKHLNMKFDMLNESYGIEEGTNLFESDGIEVKVANSSGVVVKETEDVEEQKKVIKVDAPAPPPVEEPIEDEVEVDEFSMEDEGEDPFADEEGGEDMGDEEGMEEDGDETTKKIQKYTGKIGQLLRDKDEPDAELDKYVINSIISAINWEDIPVEDVEDIISKIEGEDDEDGEGDEFATDDVYSKNTANADFPSEYQRGGGVRRLIENYFPGNIVGPRRTYRNEIQRVYDPRTGKTVVMPINMGNLSRVNVDKSRFWSGKPKKYTMYFNGQSGQPSTTSKGNAASQTGRDRYCLDFPNSPNCQGAKKPVRDNYPEDTRENNKNQRSGRQSYGFINDLKLRMQGLDEYGNPKGSKQSDKVPLSNEEMLIKQGKIWDEKSKRWIVKPEPLSAPMQYMKDSLTVPNNPQPFSSDQLINTSGPRNSEMQYGGGLEMFIPRAQNGFQTPVSPGECPMGSTKNAAGDCVDFMGKVVKKRSTGSDFGNNTQDMKQPGVMDQDYKNPLTGEKPGVIRGADGNLKMNQEDPTFYGDQYAVDVENKSDKGKLTFGKGNTGVSEARLNMFNAGVDIADSLRRGKEYNKAENEMYENLSSNNLYASDSTRDRGDYDTNSGLFRPDEQGQMQSSQYGGDVYQDGGYVEGDEVFMTDEEIQEFLANGGDLEFI